jgi:hypothetical protein
MKGHFFKQLVAFAGAATISSFLAATSAFSADEAGTILGLKGEVTANGTDGQRTLLKDDAVFVGDTIETGPNSYLVIEFIDGAKATMRPDSTLEIARYAHTEADNGALLSLVKGGLRAVTGAIAHREPDSYKVKTPVATLGVRGTEYYLRICEQDCAEEQQLYVQNMVEQESF